MLTNNHLVKLWAERYLPDLSNFSLEEASLSASQLVELSSPKERKKTTAKIQRLLQISCECAGIEAQTLFSYIPNVVNLAESARIAHFVGRVYEKAMEIYQENTYLLASPAAISMFHQSTSMYPELIAMPVVEELAMAFEPILQELRQQHLEAKDPRALGFITTQFHFSTQSVLKWLTPPEQLLLSPYFRFIEEQVCIPLQRVCQAASVHVVGSPALAIVEQMIPVSYGIAHIVYRQATQLYPNYHSRRGKLTHPGITASAIRDLEMFQAYLWLCLLQRSMAAMESELLPLCTMVLPSLEVKWELVQHMLHLLVDELLMRLAPAQKRLLLPYTQAMQQMFSVTAIFR